MILAAFTVALAAPLPRQTSAWVDGGYILDQPAIAFGAGHLWAPAVLRIGIDGSVGARATFVENHPQAPAFGLGTVTLGGSSKLVGFVALLDVAVLPADEEDCNRFGNHCRHPWWLGTDDLGMSFSPGGALRFEGAGAGGGRWSLLLGAQPYQRYQSEWWVIPRVDATATVGRFTSVHVWAHRYGAAFGVSRRLGSVSAR